MAVSPYGRLRELHVIALRRGRGVDAVVTSQEIDITFDLGPAYGWQRRHACAPWRPPIEVFEIDSALVVRAEIGGLREDQIDVALDEDHLLIRGERSVVLPGHPCLYHESRVRYGPFAAAVRVPFPVDVARALAAYADGFLTVTLPRLAATTIAPRDSAGGMNAFQENIP
jgi:HSP20 family protein